MGGASKETAAAAPPEGMEAVMEIHALAKKHRISSVIMAGVCALKGWRTGKQVAEGEFLAAVKEFEHAPIGRSKAREKEGKGC